MSYRNPLMLPLALLLTAALPATAESLPSKAEMWRIIQKQQQEIDALKAQVQETRAITEARQQPEAGAEPAVEGARETAAAEATGGEKKPLPWQDRITLSGTVEVEANKARDFNRTRTSDINLATAELGFDIKINDWVNSQVVLLYEDPDTDPVNVDTATITLGDTSRFPLLLTAGLMASPFGHFATNMISDPMPLELAENTREGTVMLGFEYQGWHGAVYTFNGDTDLVRHGNNIRQGGGRIGYILDRDGVKLDMGVDYTNSLDDADNLTERLATNTGGRGVDHHVEALAGHVFGQYAGFTAIGEYVTALDSFRPAEMLWTGRRARPKAWQTELGYTFDVLEKETTVSAGWQGTKQAVDLGLPASRVLGAVKVGVLENTTVGVEYARDKDYETRDGGTGNSGHVATMQLAVTF